MIAISRRSFKIDVEGKIFTCKELSAGYIKTAQDGGDDSASLAIKDGGLLESLLLRTMHFLVETRKRRFTLR